MSNKLTLEMLAELVHKLSGSTDITVRNSISVDTMGNKNEKFSIFYKRWIHGDTAQKVFDKWEKDNAIIEK